MIPPVTGRCCVSLSARPPGPGTARELVEEARAELHGKPVDLALLLASTHAGRAVERIALQVHELLRPRAMIGATGEGVIGDGLEYENEPVVALWAAHLPGARARSFHLSHEDLERLDSPAGLHEHLGLDAGARPSFVLLADPFSVDPLDVLQRFADAYPGRPVVGGMASGAKGPRQSAIIFDGQTLRHGLAGLALGAGVQLDCVVSQGCRPIGQPWIITEGHCNVIQRLGGQTPLRVLRDLIASGSDEERDLMRRGLLIGFAFNEQRASFGRGDFLIRNLVRLDPDTGELEVNDYVRVGVTVQFHVRDARSAQEELDEMLARAPRDAVGSLLFSCNGRGTRLFDQPHHDAQAVTRACPAPLAGLFCAGEIGPIGDRNFLHGHTASIGFIRTASA
ncbi:MAG: FIST C-terminal domain-containing protein [Phycisphaerae bacterium]|nr:FIST C-terminal domain-containing protein [Phycisphaerae bacterium]MCZ2400344.1 FIST C-terminal domain-containing protein [Phycisphaerae bacterium]